MLKILRTKSSNLEALKHVVNLNTKQSMKSCQIDNVILSLTLFVSPLVFISSIVVRRLLKSDKTNDNLSVGKIICNDITGSNSRQPPFKSTY